MHEDVIGSEMWEVTTWDRWRPYVRRFLRGFGISMLTMVLLPAVLWGAKEIVLGLAFIAQRIYEAGGPYVYLGALALVIAVVVGLVVAIFGENWG